MSDAGAGFVLPVDKPAGPTSHDVVAMVRRALGVRRVGHTGTLDPFASGLLLACVGAATRLSEYLTGLDKTYDAVARLGVRTDTHDDRGEVLEETEAWEGVGVDELRSALECLSGEVDQVPPQFSAKKVGGEAMHRRARRGERVELPATRVTVHEIGLTGFEPPFARFQVRCSSGTYVRALARDLGERLGVGAHLTELRRTAVGDFTLDQALVADALGDPAEVARVRIDPLVAVGHLPAWDVTSEGARELGFGRAIDFDGPEPDGPIVIARDRTLVAIGVASDGMIHPKKVFVS